ncbi:MAG: PIG-L family deacetylase [Methanobrevibacter sp.]|jgi:LmbE family N-acetylglucosaminyl deacetylase|nr:PIG-L family deacetylase [Candidatus Methanovirga aequatorialis]
MSKSVIFFSIIVIALICASVALFAGNIGNASVEKFNETLSEIKSSDRIIVFAPHPDDDVLANSGIIREALRKNADIRVVFMTVGDALDQNYLNLYLRSNNITDFKGNIGELRHGEALTALSKIGLSENNTIFLGYPDQGMKKLFLNNWDYDNLLKQTYGSNQNNHSPYNFTFERNAPYCGVNVVKNLNQIFDDFNPSIILTPDEGDDHIDHWATNAFVRYVTVGRGYAGSNYHYLVHKGLWPNPSMYSPEDQLLPPEEYDELDATWLGLFLHNDDEELKLQAINSHKTQTFATKNYLQSFVRKDEYFAFYPVINVQREEKYSLDKGMPKSSFKDLKGESIHHSKINHNHGRYQKISFNNSRDLNHDELDSVGLVRDNENLYAVLKSANFNTNYNYIFYLCLYDGSDYRRLDINATQGVANYLFKSSDNVVSSQKLEIETKDTLTSVKIPLNIINNTQTILITVDERNDHHTLDNTALRVFKL